MTASPIPAASPLPTLSEAALAESRRFREDFGLRSDDPWLLRVATDPLADRISYGVPLTREEVEELGKRLQNIDAIREAVIGYGEGQPDDWAGAYIDQIGGGILVAQFSANVDLHRVALQTLVRPGSPLRIESVRWSLQDLEALFDRIRPDDPWFNTIPAVVWGVGPNIVANRFEIEVSAADPRADALIRGHFGLGLDILQVSSDGTGALLLEVGTLRVRAVNGSGDPVPGLACAAYPDLDGAYETRPLPMPTSNAAGICQLRLPATGYWVHLERGEAPPEVVAIGRAVVMAGEQTEVTIVIP